VQTSDAILIIRERSGISNLSYWQLRYLIKSGRIAAPKLNASLVWVWSAQDIANAVKFLKERAQQSAAKATAKA
jgi:hypothetical protein